MNRDDLAGIARRWISLWSVPFDAALFDALHADDFVDESSAGRAPTKEAFRRGIEEFLAAFPDLKTTADDLVVDEPGQRVAVRWSSVGTNRRAYMGHGPTRKPVRITGIEIIEIRDGRLVRRWGEWDISGFLTERH